jgi:hypothetical protein
MLTLGKYSMGIGDRFGHEGPAQLAAFLKAKGAGIEVHPVWNKSNREHTLIGTEPGDTRAEADSAVRDTGWPGSYFVDADHINLSNVDRFIAASDFFTLDVADYIGEAPADEELAAFVRAQEKYVGPLVIPGIDAVIDVTPALLDSIGRTFLKAVKEAGTIYRHIAAQKGAGTFVTEVSMDESMEPQTPVQMFFILAMIAAEGIPAQTIAPKFTGRFNKGVDYVGDVAQFAREFEEDLAVIAFAIGEFGLPENLKLSVHSGSDKFSLYGPIHRAITRHNAGLHLKTAGTTWLEEVIGLAMAGGEGLAIAKDVYRAAYDRFAELSAPYATVIDIDHDKLPTPDTVEGWSGEMFADTLRHDRRNPRFNLHFRQLVHVAFKVAAEMGNRYTDALDTYREIISEQVTTNIYERHLKPVFVGV